MTEATRTTDLETRLRQLEEENEQLRRGYASLSQRLIGLRMLQRISRDLVSELDLDRLLRRILRSAINAVEGKAGALLLLDAGGRELIFAVVEGGGGEALAGQRMGRDQGLAGWVVSQRQPVIVPDVRQDDRFYAQIPRGVHFEVESLICVPLLAKGQAIGAIQVLNKIQGARFDDDDLDILTSFAAQSAAAIENARLYQELRREQERLVAVEEEVRRRLARNLHDGPAQLLANTIMGLEFALKLSEHEPENVPQELESLLPTVQKALRQVRTLLFDLRPVILETQGLVPALESYVERQRELDDLDYQLEVQAFGGRLVPPAERAIFAIVQEAIGNVRKHADARRVCISLLKEEGRLQVSVEDDGRGFEVEQVMDDYDQRGSLGMINMRERARDIGGRLFVRSRPQKGTSVILVVPLSPLRLADAEA